MEDITGTQLIFPEEHKSALKFKDDHIADEYAKLLKSCKAESNLLSSPIFPNDHCSKKFLQLMTRDDKVIRDLLETIKYKRPMGTLGTYMKNFSKDLHVKVLYYS